MVFGKKEKDTAVCQGCGAVLSKSKFKVCKKCGMILCPKCRKHHTCRVIRIEEQTNQTIFLRGDYANPQCIIKISDMRIYEIARFPGIMTDEEKDLILHDPDVHRRYVHYQEIIEEKGY